MLLTCLVFRFHCASYLQICPVHFWIETTTSMQMISIFLLNSQGSPLEWKRWNNIACNIRKDYAYYLQKQGLKKKKKSGLNCIPTHDHCDAAKCSTNWAVDWSQLPGTRTKISLHVTKTPLILKKVKLLLWHFHRYRFDTRNVVIFDATLSGSPMGYARKEQSFALLINLFPF